MASNETVLGFTKPSWYARLESGDVLPPPPDGGWSRWWDEYNGYIWLIIIGGAIGVAYRLLELAAERGLSRGL